jgi:hypothetical protein
MDPEGPPADSMATIPPDRGDEGSIMRTATLS